MAFHLNTGQNRLKDCKEDTETGMQDQTCCLTISQCRHFLRFLLTREWGQGNGFSSKYRSEQVWTQRPLIRMIQSSAHRTRLFALQSFPVEIFGSCTLWQGWWLFFKAGVDTMSLKDNAVIGTQDQTRCLTLLQSFIRTGVDTMLFTDDTVIATLG